MRAISFGSEKKRSSAPTKTAPPTIIIIIERERARWRLEGATAPGGGIVDIGDGCGISKRGGGGSEDGAGSMRARSVTGVTGPSGSSTGMGIGIGAGCGGRSGAAS